MDLNFQRPKRINVEELTANYGRFSAEPFERGYGSTVGIAMRRVLLSLIEGAAVTAIRIDGVLHEFSVIPGVFEDVLNFILNIKNIPFKLNSDEPQFVRVDRTEAGEILSDEIISDGDVEVLDTTKHIAYLEEGGSLKAEILIKNGLGFKLAEQNFDESLPVDFIPVDSNFNPVERVKYSIKPARVGKRTDYEKLILEVWTNGSVSPKDTVSTAAKILRDHMSIFLGYKEKDKAIFEDEQESGHGIESKSEFLEKNVESMGLSVRALKCLKRLGVNHIYELIEKTEHELLNSKNFGKKSLEEIISKLIDFDLALGQKLPENLKKELLEKVEIAGSEESEEIKE
ncbi:MAG: DNA-directed RNA polymerase subunit alpha [Acidobacteriota bacterium]